jgi:hypothetical protein
MHSHALVGQRLPCCGRGGRGLPGGGLRRAVARGRGARAARRGAPPSPPPYCCPYPCPYCTLPLLTTATRRRCPSPSRTSQAPPLGPRGECWGGCGPCSETSGSLRTLSESGSLRGWERQLVATHKGLMVDATGARAQPPSGGTGATRAAEANRSSLRPQISRGTKRGTGPSSWAR